MKARRLYIALLLAACGASTPPPANAPTTGIDAALAGPQRPAAERARDVYRHPRETLAFFGLTESMTVVELAPGQGWYTAVLAPILHDKGKLFITVPAADAPPEAQQNGKALRDRLAKDPAVFGNVATVAPDPKAGYSLGPDGSADMVLTFRNLHGWIRDDNLGKVFAAAFRVLKSGGVLGVVEHRAKEGGPTDAASIEKSGYVPEAMAIDAGQKAGFKLATKSEVNANPKDTKDYPKGVWTLPPTFTEGATDHDKYAAIGESDRMTLKFVKP